MEAIKKYYDDLPEKILIPKNFVHKKGKIIIILDDDKTLKNNGLKDFFGSIADFPDRDEQGNYEERVKI